MLKTSATVLAVTIASQFCCFRCCQPPVTTEPAVEVMVVTAAGYEQQLKQAPASISVH